MNSIKIKLILAFVLTTTLSLSTMAFFSLWSFDRGFVDYVKAQELEMLNELTMALESHYLEQGGWEKLRSEPYLWPAMHRNFLPGEAGKHPPEPARLMTAIARDGGQPRSTEMDDRQRRSPPRRENSRRSSPGPEGEYRRPPPRRGGPQSGPGEDDLPRRLSLLDAQGLRLLGPPVGVEDRADDSEAWVPLMQEDKVVGYLALRQARQLQDRVDIGFIAQQRQRLLLIGLGALILSALIALPLASHLVRPINALVDATRSLSSGNYSARTKVLSEDELGQLTRDFNQLAETLAANERDRKQWVSDISHELRTPLAVIRGQVEAMIDGIRKPSEKELNTLNGKVLHLNSLIDDLYELSLSDQGALNYRKEVLPLSESLNTAIVDFEHRFIEKSIQFETDFKGISQCKVLADDKRLQQLWANLMTNSLRYTDSPGEFTLSARCDQHNAYIAIDDSSPGVTSADMPRLFDRLFRVDKSRSRESGGAGLGLTLCKNIVDAHQGTISAGPSTLGGLRITVSLPLATA